MHGLSELLKQGVDLSACGVTLQADNTAREVENSILMRLMSCLVSDALLTVGA